MALKWLYTSVPEGLRFASLLWFRLVVHLFEWFLVSSAWSGSSIQQFGSPGSWMRKLWDPNIKGWDDLIIVLFLPTLINVCGYRKEAWNVYKTKKVKKNYTIHEGIIGLHLIYISTLVEVWFNPKKEGKKRTIVEVWASFKTIAMRTSKMENTFLNLKYQFCTTKSVNL